ncbi:MAG: hypothetical protein HYY41_05035 [Chloroflexi bacterium]|nr:hypothetical protein [Chloroflexota bacterium]
MADIIDEVFIQHSQDIRVMVVDKDSKSGEEEELEKMRHSAAHVMAEAVQSIFPDVRFAIGPAIANGFYYDFDLPRSLTPDDLPIIEAKMVDIIASNVAFIREEVTREKPDSYSLRNPISWS